MKANASPMSVADYCHAYNGQKIIVNDEYQRKEGLWSAQARSFFIESILLEYPIPKLYLYTRLDLATRATVKEIVDGQQRSQALVAFFNDKLRLSTNIENEELRGKRYKQLGDDWQTKFLTYSLPIDQFSGVPDSEVREAFRRMNANNVPLNDEEQRNARYQGPFKWFIVSMAERFRDVMFSAGLFSKRDLVRMSDLKFYADVVFTMDEGFRTIKGQQIDGIYKKYNSSFSTQEEYETQLSGALISVSDDPRFRRPVFLRPHVFQSITLASVARQSRPMLVEGAAALCGEVQARLAESAPDLEALERALVEPENFPELEPFVSACTQKTNVDKSRAIRFLYFFYSDAVPERVHAL